MQAVYRIFILLFFLVSVVSCTVFEKTPISIQEAVGVGSVKITLGTPVSLEEAVYLSDKLWVVFHPDSAVLYDYISSYEDHYFGVVDTRMDSLNEQIIKVIFPRKTLRSIVFKEIVQVGEMKFIGLKSYEKRELCTECILTINKYSRTDSAKLTIAGIVGAIGLAVALVVVALKSIGIGISFGV